MQQESRALVATVASDAGRKNSTLTGRNREQDQPRVVGTFLTRARWVRREEQRTGGSEVSRPALI